MGIFVDNSEGAFLQTAGPMTGGEACALLPGSGGVMSCVMDPAATSASAAALLHAAPVAHVDAAASSKVCETFRVFFVLLCVGVWGSRVFLVFLFTPRHATTLPSGAV